MIRTLRVGWVVSAVCLGVTGCGGQEPAPGPQPGATIEPGGAVEADQPAGQGGPATDAGGGVAGMTTLPAIKPVEPPPADEAAVPAKPAAGTPSAPPQGTEAGALAAPDPESLEKLRSLGLDVDADDETHQVRVDLPDEAVTEEGVLKPEIVAALKVVPQVVELSFGELSDAGAADLAAFPKLRRLSLSYTQVTDAGMAHVAGLTALEEVSLSNLNLSDAGLTHLKGARHLQVLNLDHYGEPEQAITEKGLAALSLGRLRELRINYSKVTDAGLALLQDAAELTELQADHCPITDAGLKSLQGLKKLESLRLQGTEISDAGLAHLRGCTQLQYLSLNGCGGVTDAGLEHLAELPLEALEVAETGVTPVGAHRLWLQQPACDIAGDQFRMGGGDPDSAPRGEDVARLVELSMHVDVNNSQLTAYLSDKHLTVKGGLEPEVLETLQQMPTLTRLAVDTSELTDAGLKDVARLTQLRELVLEGGAVTDAGLAQLTALSKLRLLGMQRCAAVTDAALEALAGLTQLRLLQVYGTQVTRPAAAALREKLWRCEVYGSEWQLTDYAPLPSVTEEARAADRERLQGVGLEADSDGQGVRVFLSEKYLTRDGRIRADVLTALQGCPTLTSIHVSSELSDAGVEAIGGFRQLQQLSLARTSIGDAGLAHLRGLTKLRQLSLSYTKVTDAGLVHLQGMQDLRSLELSGNQLTDAGLAHLSELQRLTSLDLSGAFDADARKSKVTDAGLALLKLSNLQNLDVSRTNVTGSFLQGLTECEDLWDVTFTDCPIVDDSLQHLPAKDKLGYLHLNGTRVTDAGLAHLKSLRALRWLDVQRCPGVSDAGLKALERMHGLTRVDVSETRVTRQGAEALRKARRADLTISGGSPEGYWRVPEDE